ncbi:MAG: MBL fold metallo-hydrolase [Treponema sp.]|nr:MBL fold metallo-hydrolase [Treponema sp.]
MALVLLILVPVISFIVPGFFQGLGAASLPAEIVFVSTRNDADCIILGREETAVIIDTGEKDDYPSIKLSLDSMGVKKIALLVISHPDKDHIGSAVPLLEDYRVDVIVIPFYTKENRHLPELRASALEKRIPVIEPLKKRSFSAAGMRFLVFPANEKFYQKTNNYSLSVLAVDGKVNMLFTGDAEEKRLKELMALVWPKIDLLKIPHHGRDAPSSRDFIRLINPEYALVTSDTCGKAVRDACTEAGAEIFFSRPSGFKFSSNRKQVIPIQ